MDIIYSKNYDEMGKVAASLLISAIEKKPDLLLCTATGNSPTGLYRELVFKSQENKVLFNALKILKLDEWGGVPENHPVTCENYLKKNLIDPLNISGKRFISFRSNPLNVNTECERIKTELEKQGPIDVCILGMGKNGHIGFNEPASVLEPFCHVAKLSATSLTHSMVESIAQKPTYGLTLGMMEILNSRKIILLVTGAGKQEIVVKLLQKKIDTFLPTSFLWLHPNLTIIIDNATIEIETNDNP